MGVDIFKVLFLSCFILQIYSLEYSHLSKDQVEFIEKHFRCQNGRYINNVKFCDGSKDCEDDSDESTGCNRGVCGKGKFHCDHAVCLPITARCNNLKDCADGTDELNCGDEVKVDKCPLSEGKFLCEDKLRCIGSNQSCDGYCNCLDCSDEDTGCLYWDKFYCDKCSYACAPYPEGAYFFKNASNASIVPECEECNPSDNYFTGAGKCITLKPLSINSRKFICDENYINRNTPIFNGSDCVNPAPFENLIVYSTSNEIKIFNRSTNLTDVVRSGVDCTALQGAQDYVYCASVINDKGIISKTSISTKETVELIRSDSAITSIAVDWITNNIYFTTNTTLSVCKNDGKLCRALKVCRGCTVGLAPRFGWLFWSAKGAIKRSNMDGSNEIIFAKDDNPSVPLFAIDETINEVYYGYPSLTGVHVVNLNKPLVQFFTDEYKFASENWSSLSKFEGRIYYSVKNQSTIYHRNKKSQGYIKSVLFNDSSATVLKNVYAYNPRLQKTNITNPCKAASCSDGLCLLRQATPYKGLNHTCVRANNQYFRNFRCSSGEYIPSYSFCDGVNDCEDGSDESTGCDKASCGNGKFKCGDGSCLSIASRCNSKKECSDGSDEVNCTSHENIFVYSTQSEIILYNLTTQQTSVIGNESNSQPFSGVNNYLYYSLPNKDKTLLKVAIDSKNVEEVIKLSLFPVTSIAIDWITNNTYFTTNTSLFVSQKPQIITKLKDCSACLVTLAPRHGLMFWSNSTNILQSAMDGSDEKVFVKGASAVSLAIDEGTDGVYWFNGDEKVVMFKAFNGSETEDIIWGLPETQNLTTFSVLENKIFYVEPNSSIIRIVEVTDDHSIIEVDVKNNVSFLHAYNPLLQQSKISNPCAKASCVGLCLIKPASSPKTLDYSCICDKLKYSEPQYWCDNQGESKSLLPAILITLLIVIIIASLAIYYVIRKKNSGGNRQSGHAYHLGRSNDD